MSAAGGIAVAVATLDRPEGLARCLAALCDGELRPAEVIVVDQGRGEDPGPAFPELPVLYLRQHRRGLAASRNLALARARSPVVAVTDDDCVPDRGWVAALARAFASPAAPDAVCGRVLPLGPERPGTYALSSRPGTRRVDYAGPAVPWAVGTGANLAVRREWMARIGPYDERLGAGSPGCAGEDVDVLYRLLRAGARIRFEPAAVVHHERQGIDRRLASRSLYGRGLGACCGLWLRGRDPRAAALLARWVALRGALLARALGRGRWQAAREELLVLSGTAHGLAYGLRGGRPA